MAQKIEQHKLKQERKKLDKLEKEKMERIRKAKEAHAKAAAAGDKMGGSSSQTGSPFGGASPPGMEDFYKILQDPELITAFQVSASIRRLESNLRFYA